MNANMLPQTSKGLVTECEVTNCQVSRLRAMYNRAEAAGKIGGGSSMVKNASLHDCVAEFVQ